MVSRAISYSIKTLPTFSTSQPLIVVKPNLTTQAKPEDVVTTDPRVVQALVQYLRKNYQNAKIYVVDNPSLAEKGFSKSVFETTGVEEAAMSAGATGCSIEIDDPECKDYKTVPVYVEDPLVLERVDIYKIIYDADLLINLAKMKTIVDELVTLGLKNWQGITPYSRQWPEMSSIGRQDELVGQQQAFHRTDHPQKIVDLHKARTEDLTLIDGLWAMEGQGPWSGGKVKMGLILAGDDTVAVDATACRCMGIEPSEVSTIRIASMDKKIKSLEMGRVKEEDIDVTLLDIDKNSEQVYHGKKAIERVRKWFSRPCWSPVGVIPSVHVHVGGTCIGCMANIRVGLDYLLDKQKKHEFSFEDLGEVHIITGVDVYIPSSLRGLVYVVGDCATLRPTESKSSTLERAGSALAENAELVHCKGCAPVHAIEHMAKIFEKHSRRR